ncbi:MAG: type II toxin-antitoxin system VapB family antitoxin [Verrucomicrobiales bacterium]
MATNVELDEALIAEARRLGNQPSKRATIEEALREYVQRRKQLDILRLFGGVEYERGYDYKKLRRRR